MYLEAITICVNYSDFLSHTLPYNKDHFDDIIVITDTQDDQTKKLCEVHDVKCIQTDIFYENGCTFNKGAAINYGLSQLEKKDWVVHLDADIYLPPHTRSILENIPLETHKLYGADRLMCPSYEDWINFLKNSNSPQKIKSFDELGIYNLPDARWIFVDLNFFPIGTRHADFKNKNSGYYPIGYFQLWNPQGSNILDYPTQFDSCDVSDILHCKNFSGQNRQLLPEIVVIHLDSEDFNGHNIGKNWKGRKTKPFKLVQDKANLENGKKIKNFNYT